MSGDDFYRDMVGFDEFLGITATQYYRDAPADWYVLLTDVQGSTQAIEAGKYKEVNLIGAAAIMAILNIAKGYDLPYVFGGDGATMLIPASLLTAALETLSAVQAKVKAMYQMELRAGCVSLQELYAQGAWLKVAKYHLSPNISQAVFQGTACALAERWLKKGGGPVLASHARANSDVDLTGLECRWQPLENRNGMILSVLVKVQAAHQAQAWTIYRTLIAAIAEIYPDEAAARPTHVKGLQLSLSLPVLMKEAALRGGQTRASRMCYLLRIFCIGLVGRWCFASGRPLGSFDGQRYLAELVANSDARKFDEMLRMVVDSTPEQHRALEQLLQKHHQQGEIAYGLHLSSQAMMTCLVFSLVGHHIHFIDGADGGYALAALQMKQQLV